jgi:hypothetical protein
LRPARPAKVVDEEQNELERVRKATKSSSVAVASATVALRESSARRKRV